MTFIGLALDDDVVDIEQYVYRFKCNAEKPEAMMLFRFEAYALDSNIIAIYKDFMLGPIVDRFFLYFFTAGLIALVLWHVYIPLIIVGSIFIFWQFLNSARFNYWMAKAGLRKMGYKGVVRCL